MGPNVDLPVSIQRLYYKQDIGVIAGMALLITTQLSEKTMLTTSGLILHSHWLLDCNSRIWT